MEVKSSAVGSLDTNCYIVSSGGKCVIIDPGGGAQDILSGLSASALEVQAIILTHGHFDHFLAAGVVQEATGAPVYVGAPDLPWVTEPGWMSEFVPAGSAPAREVSPLSDGDVVAVGDENLRVICTPGHSPGSVCLYAPGVLFAGDLLFRRNVGRTDLPGGDRRALRESLAKIARLPKETVVYPGHGPSTTIALEKAHNPFLS